MGVIAAGVGLPAGGEKRPLRELPTAASISSPSTVRWGRGLGEGARGKGGSGLRQMLEAGGCGTKAEAGNGGGCHEAGLVVFLPLALKKCQLFFDSRQRLASSGVLPPTVAG